MLLLALHLTRAHADELDGVAALDAPDAPAAERAPVSWAATDAVYTVTIPEEGPLTLTLTWRLATPERGWAELPLVGPGMVVQSVTGAPTTAGPAGLFAVLPPTQDRATIVVRGTLDRAGPGAATLAVLPAARQRVVVNAPGLDVKIAGATDGWLAAADTLALTWAPHTTATPLPQRPIVHAEAATAVWAEPGALLSQTVARWKVVRGAVDRFELDVAGLEEVDATGPNLGRATREGNRLVLTPRTPVKGSFEVRVRARRPVSGDDDVLAPAPRPVASRVERFWTVGRAEDGELVPVGGPRAVSVRALPEWGRGLSDTIVESAWEGDTPLRVRLAHYTPMMGPDTVIERAVLVVAAAAEGRALVRTTWHVRNERRQYLHVTPPAGVRPITARVSGEPVLVLSDGSGGVYVPLEKSVETVQGLLTFPVELTWIAEGEAWERKGERAVELPAVDAPIQAAEWEVYLPRGVTSKDATAAAPPPEEEAGEQELQKAVEAYKKNDFASSQAYLEQARAIGNTSSNVERLQSNLDVLLNDEESTGAEDVATRRVRDLANAKTITLQVEQDKKAEEARRAYQSGDVEKAEQYLEEVIALAEDIGVTEQKESAEQEERKEEAAELLVAVKKQKAASSGALGSKGGKRAGAAAGVEGGVEGGVVGGVLGGVLGGEPSKAEPEAAAVADELGWDADEFDGEGLGAGGQAPPQRPPSDEEPVPEPVAEAPVEGQPLSATTPVSREYQNIVQNVPGVAASERATRGRGPKPGKDARRAPAAKPDTDADGVLDQPDASRADALRYRDDTEIAFESEDIEGELVKPTGAVILDRRAAATKAPAAPPPRTGADVAAAEPAQPTTSTTFRPQERAALDVKAAPLTLAMPLGGEVVRETAALLPAGATPTLTVRYRTTGDRR